ncbi:MAG: cation diffusion facilitator family transporter [Planctomycetota bacterium]
MSISTPTPDQHETEKRARACKIAMAASFFVGFIELAVGYFQGMASLGAEGVHTLLDGVDSIIVLMAVYFAARPADRTHPFGHGKFEALGAAIEGAFMVAAAIGIAYEAIGRLMRDEMPERIPLYTVAVMACAAVFYQLVSAYLMRLARETKSPAVLAEALHLRTHIYITGGVAGGLLIGSLGHYPIADTILALAIAVCLILIAGHVFKEVFSQFTDASLPEEEVNELAAIVSQFGQEFVEVHGLRTRRSGAERHIEMHLVMLPETTVVAAHSLSHQIEAAILGIWPTTRTAIHIEPINTAVVGHEEWLRGQPKVRTKDATPDEREFIH